jgi:hypothetical protein
LRAPASVPTVARTGSPALRTPGTEPPKLGVLRLGSPFGLVVTTGRDLELDRSHTYVASDGSSPVMVLPGSGSATSAGDRGSPGGRAADLVPSHGEIGGVQTDSTPHGHEPPVATDGDPLGGVEVAEVCRHLAVAVERGVQGSVGVVPGQGEFAIARYAALPAATILPSAWMATSSAVSLSPKLVVTFPSPSNVGSRDPLVL